MPCHHREWTQNVNSPCVERPRADDRVQFFFWHMDPIVVSLTLITSLRVFLAVFFHGGPIVTNPYHLERYCFPSDVTSGGAFVQFSHDSVGFL